MYITKSVTALKDNGETLNHSNKYFTKASVSYKFGLRDYLDEQCSNY